MVRQFKGSRVAPFCSRSLVEADSQDSFVKFTMQTNDQLYTQLEQVLFKEVGETGRFSYPADDPFAAEFEEQMTSLLREYKGQGEYLCAAAPEVPGGHDDVHGSGPLIRVLHNRWSQ